MRRRGAILHWVLFCFATAGTDWARANTNTASVDASLAGWLDQWQLKDQPAPGPALASEACAPTTVVNAMVYLQNQYPEIYGTNLAGTNQTNYWAQTAVLLAGPNYMKTDTNVGTVPVVNLTLGLRSFLSDRGFASTRVSGMLPQGTNGGLVNELIGPLPSDYVEGLPTFDYFATALRGGSPVTLQILYEGQSLGHNVLLTRVDWTGSGAGATGTMEFIDPLDPANYTNGFPASLKVTTGTVSILPSIFLTNTNGVVDTLSNVLALDYQQYKGELPYDGTNYEQTTALIGGATIMQVPEPRVVPLVLLAIASIIWFRVWRRNRTEG